MVLILTADRDPHADLIITALQGRGCAYRRLNPGSFPAEVDLALVCADREGSSIRLGGQRVGLDDVETVWWRQPDPPAAQAITLDAYDRRESSLAMGSLWQMLADRFWVNPYASYRSSRCKPYQLQMAELAGWDVPRTLISSRPSEVLAFVDDCGGEAIYKTFEPTVRSRPNGTRSGIYTSRLTHADIERRLPGIGCSPCLFQERVSKNTELRVTVMGDQIFTVEISTPDGQDLPDDWRRDTSAIIFRPATLSTDIEARILDLVRRLGLVFGCLDFATTRDGRLVFFEVNPSGQWCWVEQKTGLPMLEAFIDMITSRRDGRTESHRSEL